MSGDKILKIGHSLEEATHLLKNAGATDPEGSARQGLAQWAKLIAEVRTHLNSGRLDPRLISGTRIDEKGQIWQDRTPAVNSTLDLSNIGAYDPAQITQLIDKFAAFFPRLWKCGAHETECSLFTNYGLYSVSGALTSPDFGNMTFSYEEARRSIEGVVTAEDVNRFLAGELVPQSEEWPDWFFKGQVREALRAHPELFRYYVSTMSRALSIDNFEATWPQEFR